MGEKKLKTMSEKGKFVYIVSITAYVNDSFYDTSYKAFNNRKFACRWVRNAIIKHGKDSYKLRGVDDKEDEWVLSNSNGSNRVVYQGCYKVILGKSDIK